MIKARNYSITKRLTMMNILVSGAALFMACAAFVAYDLVTFRQTMVHNLSIQAQITGSNSVSALLFSDPQTAENTLSALQVAPHIVSAGIYQLDGRPFAAYWRHGSRQIQTLPAIPSGQAEVHRFENGELVVERRIVFQGEPAGTVYIRSDLQEMNHRLKRYAGIAALVLLACLIGHIWSHRCSNGRSLTLSYIWPKLLESFLVTKTILFGQPPPVTVTNRAS